MKDICSVLGILQHAKQEDFPAEALALLEERIQARAAKNWARADEIRDALKAMCYTVEDSKDGAKLKKL